MRLEFLVFEDTADPEHDQSLRVLQRIHPPTLRIGVLQTESVGLLLCATSRVPGQQRCMAAIATSSICARSTSSPGHCSPQCCRTIIFPQPLASFAGRRRSSDVSLRVAKPLPYKSFR